MRLVDDDFDVVDHFLHLLAGSIDNRRAMIEQAFDELTEMCLLSETVENQLLFGEETLVISVLLLENIEVNRFECAFMSS